MEVVAWLSHKYLMHGPLWSLHRDHHKKELNGLFEHNDFFFLIFAIPGIAALLLGIHNGYNYLFWIGIGICCYGLMYFLVHDIFIHQRVKIFRNTGSVILKPYAGRIKCITSISTRKMGNVLECYGCLLNITEK